MFGDRKVSTKLVIERWGNKLSANRICEFLAGALFLLLFPGFFIYHYFLAAGVIYPFLGGGFGPISVIGMLVIVPLGLYVFLKIHGRVVPFIAFFGLLVLYVGLWSGVHFLWGTTHQQSYLALKGSAGLLVFWVLMFTIGFFLNIQQKWVWYGQLVGFIFMTLLTLLNIDFSKMMFFPRQEYFEIKGVASYQGFARSFVVTTILLLAFNRRLLSQVLIFTIGCVTLFFIGARSEFYGFILVGGIWIAQFFWQRGIDYRILFLFVVMVLIFSVFAVEGLHSSRQLQIFDLSSSGSWQRRLELFNKGWYAIMRSPLFADYAGQIIEGGFGAYIHNGISAWRQFGLVGFFLYMGISGVSLSSAFFAVQQQRWDNPRSIAALYMNVMCVALIIVAKSVFWVLPSLAWGMTARLLANERNINSNEPY